MAGPVKTVCFIASLVIAWNLFEVGEAIVAWFDYKISGTEIPWNLKINPNRANHMISILVHGLFLLGISKKTTKFMIPWTLFFTIYIVAGLIPTGIFGFRLELVSKELNHFGVIADLFRQIGGHSSRFVLFCSF